MGEEWVALSVGYNGTKAGFSVCCNLYDFWLPMLDDIRNFLVSPPADFLARLQSLKEPKECTVPAER